ncbi:MAG: hypothetical protein ABSD75_32145 [Terriglobales bacterium]|jgi:hypothetical protein
MALLFSLGISLASAVVVIAISVMLWRARNSKREGQVAIVASTALALWSIATAVLAHRGVFQPQTAESIPPIGIALVVVSFFLTLCLISSASLRRLLSNQTYLTRLNVWRLLGIVFLLLMAAGEMPALWALPAGIGDILIGASLSRLHVISTVLAEGALRSFSISWV